MTARWWWWSLLGYNPQTYAQGKTFAHAAAQPKNLEDGPCPTNAILNANVSQRELGPTRFGRAPQKPDPITPLLHTKEGSRRRMSPFNSIPFHSGHPIYHDIVQHNVQSNPEEEEKTERNGKASAIYSMSFNSFHGC